MVEGLIGKKIGMTHIFDENGRFVPVTVIQAGPNFVTFIKTKERDGYEAVQLGFEEVKKLKKPERGHLKNLPPLRHLREFKADNISELQVGQKVDASIFQAGEKVDVTGTSKGKGFTGVVKRHGFGGGPKTHGQSDRHRAPGSIGATTTPGKVLKGQRMAGRAGGERVTVKRLTVVAVDTDRNLLLVKGAVPGANGGLLQIRKAK
ncbi:ribosomal protein L3 [Thermobaculum terrenum ATCC BAA-798]|uniref:Large ribosomal subunit protein uL3 n=1 Tax=Thermobaculum terrenum (strain ATCC BAA-798 / CCMEE 7001 / YNP1) TaxID=525904 RepID=D1CFC6_THET1|nr:50S ribosomal protein L3 [Thermobaculum terrenum]ACZ41632.1 ribosomal protein L3 [Thermobaculum terrenum ATCC BAA-798]